MKKEDLVLASEFCSINNIELSFLYNLDEYGLIQLEVTEEVIYIPVSQLPDLEKILRLYFDLDINFEGIGTIIELLRKNEAMQEEITELRNKLRFYE
jgi:chaperone modulatory protein CbpM